MACVKARWGGFLHERLFGGDGLDTYHPSEEEQLGTDKGEEDENDEDDEEDDSGSEGGLSDEVAGVDDEEGFTVDKDEKGVPLYGRKSMIFLGNE